ncbi:hypothetical protein QNI22_30225 [Cytophagaceae bacterium BD1B2-1]|uniref:Uncharacterized protein n=1 Tax=Xanthocytophaga agilis TaxID=3048010 RepID=A0AAE3RBG3_9BACT|nr:hypothetical protein [Xanthocytophaga agilis]
MLTIKDNDTTNELPPFLNTWPRMYSFVLLNLVALILLFYWFTKAFE